jgi:hypothetical protein
MKMIRMNLRLHRNHPILPLNQFKHPPKHRGWSSWKNKSCSQSIPPLSAFFAWWHQRQKSW